MSQLLEITKPLRRIAAWRLLTELVRRHPELMIIECHGGGGMYDELRVVEPAAQKSLVSCNLEGSIHIEGVEHLNSMDWDGYLAGNPRDFLHRLEGLLQLAEPRSLPRTSPRVLTYRVISQLMAQTVFVPTETIALNGQWDTSGWTPGPREQLFSHYPAIATALRKPRPEDLYGIGEYRFWFMQAGEQPGLAFETSRARVWLPGSPDAFDLMSEYKATGRELPALVAKVQLWAHDLRRE